MDTNNWRPIAAQGADDPSVETGGDWRTQLSSDSRKNIVNEIVEMLKKNAVHREEKIYAAATSKSEYLLRIALKMLSMESKSHNTVPNSLPPNPSGNNNIPPDSGADSTAQIGHSNGVDWQEEVYQQIKAMKEMYLSELYEMYQIIALELQQHDPLQPLKMAEAMLERVIAFLQVPKSNILPSFKGKLGSYEEQIKILIKVKKYIPPLQQGQLGQPHMQQTQSQVSQVQSHEKQMNPQIQSTNIQGSVPNMQQNNMVDLHHTSLCSLSGVSTSQQNIMNSLQPASSLDSGQGNAVGSLTQTTVGPLQQNTISALQQDNNTNPSGLNMLQPDIHLQSNPNMLQDQHLKQQRRMEQLILQQQILQRQKQQQQQLSQQKLMSLMQSQPALLQQQLVLQPQPDQIQRDMQSGLEASQAPGSLLQQQNVIDQQKQLYQSQRPLPETSSKLCGVLMDTSNWRPTAAQGAEPSVETGGDWRTQLPTDSRQTIVNKILETLNKHLPFFCQEELEGLKKIAVRFEEKIYTAAMSQSDYLRKISLKMLAMESKSQTTIPNSVTPNPSGNNNNELCDPGASHNMQPQVRNQGKPLPMSMSANQSQAREKNLSQNMPSNMGSTGIQSSASLTSALPSVSGLSQTSIPNVVGKNISGVPQSSAGNSMGQGVPSNMFANPQRQMPGRQQLVPQQQQQQSQNSQQYYQQLLNQKFHQQGNFQHTLVPQQNLLQPTSQQSSMQTSSVMQPSMIQSTNLSGLQQNQLSSAQQSGQSMLQHQQAVLRQLQQIQQAANVHQQLLLTQQQQQLMAQQPNATNTQQNLLTGQQNNVGEMQQQPRLMGQQNNLQNMQQHEQHQQQQHQHLMAQQNNLSSMHQPQLSSQSNVSGLQQQQQLLGTQPGNSTMQTNQHSFCPASLDSTAQTGNSNGGDWQEEVHQKIKAMKEMYYPELNEMLQKVTLKIEQHDSLPQPPKTEQLEKLKMFKTMLERILAFLQVSKINIIPSFKEKLGSYEKQIINFINSNKMRKPIPSHQQGQLGQPLMQQPQSQVSQVQSLENQINPQIQSMSMQGSVPNIQQNNIVSMQHSSLSSLSGPSSLDSAVGPLQQNTVGAPQQGNVTNFSSQSGVNMLQPNIPLQTNPNMQMMNNQKQRQIQMMKQQMLQQQQQQFNQQAKQQLPAQMQAHQMPQVHQMNDINELKIRQGMGVKPGVFQQHMSGGQRTPYTHQQLKSGASFPISSPQLLQAASPQLSQNSSPQIDQQNLLSSLTKAGTPLQSANSPFIVPSPSTPLAPSPMPGDSEKPASVLSSLSNAGNIGQQQATVTQPPAQSLAIGTPGISASPLLAEFSVSDGGGHVNAMGTIASGKSNVTEQPLERLIKVVKSMSSQALSASVSDIGSVVSMIDRIAGSAPGNGSRAAVGEDLVAMTNCRLQARNVITQDGMTGTRKMKRYTSAMPLNVVSSAGSVSDSFKFSGPDTSDLESTATSSVKRPRIEANHALLEEIREINLRLIDTVVDVSEEDVDPTAAAAAAEGGDGTIVKCSFTAVALSPNLKSQYASAQMSPIQPLRLLVPTNYPSCSPVLLDKLPVEISKEYEDLSVKAKSRFGISLRTLSQPMSLGEIARTWDVCARAVISEHAQQSGGGSFSSKYGTWENCLSAA